MGQCFRKPRSQVERVPRQRNVSERVQEDRAGAGVLQGPTIPQSPTGRPMTQQIRYDYFGALCYGFGNLSYAIIGGAALVEYGIADETSDYDVIVLSEMKEQAINQILQSGVNIVRTTSGRLG